MRNILFIISLSAITAISYAAETKTQPIEITVHRSPSCQCCGKWIAHLEKNNFKVKDILSEKMQAIKDKYNVPKNMASCHTAIVNGYVIEGHVPARDVKALLNIKPNIVGISVPGMPVGTPGMEMGRTKADAYNVVGFDKNNEHQIFNHYEAKE